MSMVVGIGVMGLITAGIMDTFSESIKIQQHVLTKQSVQTQHMAIIELLSRRATCERNFRAVVDVAALPRAIPSLLTSDVAATPVFNVGDTFDDGKFTIIAMQLANWRPRALAGVDQFKGVVDLIVSFQPRQGVAMSRVIPISTELNGFTAGAADPTQINSCVSIGNDTNQPWTLNGTGDIIYMNGNVGIDIVNPTQRLQVNGYVMASGFLHASDLRLKKDIHPAPGLAAIEKIRGVRFRWKKTNVLANGVIAQEVEGILPEAVHTAPDGEMSVNYSSLIAPLIESTHEMAARTRALERSLLERQKQIDEMRAQIKELENR